MTRIVAQGRPHWPGERATLSLLPSRSEGEHTGQPGGARAEEQHCRRVRRHSHRRPRDGRAGGPWLRGGACKTGWACHRADATRLAVGRAPSLRLPKVCQHWPGDLLAPLRLAGLGGQGRSAGVSAGTMSEGRTLSRRQLAVQLPYLRAQLPNNVCHDGCRVQCVRALCLCRHEQSAHELGSLQCFPFRRLGSLQSLLQVIGALPVVKQVVGEFANGSLVLVRRPPGGLGTGIGACDLGRPRSCCLRRRCGRGRKLDSRLLQRGHSSGAGGSRAGSLGIPTLTRSCSLARNAGACSGSVRPLNFARGQTAPLGGKRAVACSQASRSRPAPRGAGSQRERARQPREAARPRRPRAQRNRPHVEAHAANLAGGRGGTQESAKEAPSPCARRVPLAAW